MVHSTTIAAAVTTVAVAEAAVLVLVASADAAGGNPQVRLITKGKDRS
jgi:hypothetical protein